MKAIFLLTCIGILSFSTICLGQSSIEGIKLGLNYADISGIHNSLNNQSITAFDAGAFATINIAGLFTLQPELIYTMKGYKLTEQGINNEPGPAPAHNIFVTGNNSYLEIPVLLKFNIPSSSFGIVRPNIFAGPEVAFGLSSKVKVQSTDPMEQQGSTEFTNSKPTDFGIIFGAGADFNLLAMTLMFDLRYDMGVKSLSFSSGPLNAKDRVISLDMGIGI